MKTPNRLPNVQMTNTSHSFLPILSAFLVPMVLAVILPQLDVDSNVDYKL